MKTSVKNIMMSFALMGCLIFSASDAMAQGRSRSQGGSTASRSQSAAVSRSSNSAGPTVSRASSSSSMSRSSDAMPQVSRSSTSSSSIQRSTTSPQVNRGNSSSSSSVQRSSTSPQVNRGSNTSSSTKVGSSVSSADTRRDNSQMVGKDVRGTATSRDRVGTSTQSTISGKDKIGNGGKPGGNGNVDKDKNDKDRHNGKPGGNGNVDKNGKDRQNGKPNGNGRRDGHDKPNGFGGNGNHYDYTNHHYHNDFHNNYTHHSWSWSRPLPPPARPYRPAIYEWYRPVIPYGWAPYSGAPIIDRILGLTFGSLFDTSIEYLYYNGYEIDGYADHIIYLRDVLLLNHLWDDVMLSFDAGDRLVNAQFVYHSSSYNNYRYRKIYNSLTRVYGAPITSDSRGISWYGGGCTGWITLSTHIDLGHHYMTLSIGY